MADEESDSDYDLRARISALANNLGTRSTDPKFSLMVEHVHKNVSALKRPRKANILMAMARRPELEKQGLSPGEIGALRRTGAVVSRAMTFLRRQNSRQGVELTGTRAERTLGAVCGQRQTSLRDGGSILFGRLPRGLLVFIVDLPLHRLSEWLRKRVHGAARRRRHRGHALGPGEVGHRV